MLVVGGGCLLCTVGLKRAWRRWEARHGFAMSTLHCCRYAPHHEHDMPHVFLLFSVTYFAVWHDFYLCAPWDFSTDSNDTRPPSLEREAFGVRRPCRYPIKTQSMSVIMQVFYTRRPKAQFHSSLVHSRPGPQQSRPTEKHRTGHVNHPYMVRALWRRFFGLSSRAMIACECSSL